MKYFSIKACYNFRHYTFQGNFTKPIPLVSVLANHTAHQSYYRWNEAAAKKKWCMQLKLLLQLKSHPHICNKFLQFWKNSARFLWCWWLDSIPPSPHSANMPGGDEISVRLWKWSSTNVLLISMCSHTALCVFLPFVSGPGEFRRTPAELEGHRYCHGGDCGCHVSGHPLRHPPHAW